MAGKYDTVQYRGVHYCTLHSALFRVLRQEGKVVLVEKGDVITVKAVIKICMYAMLANKKSYFSLLGMKGSLNIVRSFFRQQTTNIIVFRW
jgi:hypothetical protein